MGLLQSIVNMMILSASSSSPKLVFAIAIVIAMAVFLLFPTFFSAWLAIFMAAFYLLLARFFSVAPARPCFAPLPLDTSPDPISPHHRSRFLKNSRKLSPFSPSHTFSRKKSLPKRPFRLLRSNQQRFLPPAMRLISCLLDPGMGFAPFDGSPTLALNPAHSSNVGQKDHPQQQSATSVNGFLEAQNEHLENCGSSKQSCYKFCVQNDTVNVDEELSCRYELPPSWSFSLLDSLQSMASHTFRRSEHCERSWSFETQFGWDRFLCTRLGSSWQCEPVQMSELSQLTDPTGKCEGVKVWSGQQKKLLNILKLDEVRTSALDLECKFGFVGVGNREGELSLWDIDRGTCVSSVCNFLETPISALIMGSTDSMNGMVVGGTISYGRRMAFALWDYRSSYDPFSSWAPIAHIPNLAALKCRGHDLCLVGEDNLWMHDLRMLNGAPVIALPTEMVRNLSTKTEEEAINLWEDGCSSAIEDDEEYWDECLTVMDQADSCKNLSFMSRCVVYIRSLYGESLSEETRKS